MNHKALPLAAVLASGLFVLTGQQPAPSGVFTSAQAEAGQAAYENTCGKCHTPTLRGRKGDPGEIPPLSSLPANMQETVKNAGGYVPALAGPDFIARWGSRTTADLSQRIQEAIGGFPPEGANDETAVNITAYVLQVNNAKAGTQPMTKTTAVVVSSITR